MKYYTNIDLNNNELQNAKIHNLATAPLNPQLGQVYFNTTDNKYYGYNGTSWIDLSYTHPLKHTIDDIQDLSLVLDGKADTDHTHPNYENQNAFSSITVGQKRLSALTATDTLEIATDSKITVETESNVNNKLTFSLNGETVSSAEKNNWNNKETTEGAQQKVDAALLVAKTYADTKIANLVNGAPGQLDTLKELADAIQGNQAGVADILQQIGTKANTDYVNRELAKKANVEHTHTGDEVVLTGYSKSSSSSPIVETDNVINALGKLEKALEGKQQTGDYALSNHNHDGVYEPVINKNTAFNKNFGTAETEVARGNHNHDGVYAPIVHSHTEMAKKYSANIGNGVLTTIPINHNLNTEDIVVSLIETGTKQMVITDMQIINANTINLIFATPPANNAFRVTIIG